MTVAIQLILALRTLESCRIRLEVRGKEPGLLAILQDYEVLKSESRRTT